MIAEKLSTSVIDILEFIDIPLKIRWGDYRIYAEYTEIIPHIVIPDDPGKSQEFQMRYTIYVKAWMSSLHPQ